jgi:hypothetical protein
MENEDPRRDPDEPADGERGEPGAEGGASEAADTPPGAPADDSSPLGDTDQHSSSNA